MKRNNMLRSLNGRERMSIAMHNKIPDRIPVMPQICHNHAISLFYDNFRNEILNTIENPEKTLNLVLKAAEYYNVDGLRLFLPGKKMNVSDDGKTMVVKDPNNGEVVGLGIPLFSGNEIGLYDAFSWMRIDGQHVYDIQSYLKKGIKLIKSESKPFLQVI